MSTSAHIWIAGHPSTSTAPKMQSWWCVHSPHNHCEGLWKLKIFVDCWIAKERQCYQAGDSLQSSLFSCCDQYFAMFTLLWNIFTVYTHLSSNGQSHYCIWVYYTFIFCVIYEFASSQPPLLCFAMFTLLLHSSHCVILTWLCSAVFILFCNEFICSNVHLVLHRHSSHFSLCWMLCN